MKLTGFADSFHELSVLKENGTEEVILGMRAFSRFGRLDENSFFPMVKRARELGLRIIFEWDILMTEESFRKVTESISPYLDVVDAIRVQDPGAYHWALHHTKKPLQFIAENGNHNIEALLGWCEAGLGRIERIILSIELSRDSIQEYCQKLPVPAELLGLGRILLFYSPRSLLSPLSPDREAVNEDIHALGESEESPHKGFPVLENRHGTFMFHIKEFCLLDYASDLTSLGLSWLRIDQRFHEKSFFPEAVKVAKREKMFESFREEYPQEVMRGFYHVNKSDVLFPKLKNVRLQNRSGDYLGEILEAQKGSHLAILVKNVRGIKVGDKFRIVHPKGAIFEGVIHSLKDVNLTPQTAIQQDDLAVIPFIDGVWVKSQVFLSPSEV